MSAKGWQLVHVGFCTYTFHYGESNEYNYRIELLETLPRTEDTYISFLQDMGIEFIGSYFRWSYFRKKSDGQPFDLFSDIDSIIRHLNRIIYLMLPITLLNLFIGITSIILYSHTNGYMGLLNILVAGILFYGVRHIYKKKRKLIYERNIHE